MAVLLTGCDEDLVSESSQGINAEAAPATERASDPKGDLITSSPMVFADALQKIGNENEVLVAFKDDKAPRISASTLRDIPTSNLTIALPETPTNALRRTEPGLAPTSAAAHDALLRALAAHGVEPYRSSPKATVMSLRIPDEKLVPVLAALLHHPNVDYIEANQKYDIVFHGLSRSSSPETSAFRTSLSFGHDLGLSANVHASTSTTAAETYNAGSQLLTTYPSGSNSEDTKHTIHSVLEAWDYTRGAGAEVGIMDSGYAFDQSSNQYHPDGQLLSSSKGIAKRGFVDDFNNCTTPQPYGNCTDYDDYGHGTPMAGLVGANDNNIQSVGIMPEGLTYSMKISMHCGVVGNCSGDPFKIENDDFYWSIIWASEDTDISVLSMSWSSTSSIGASSHNALYDAYHNYDILLLSSTGNPDDAGQGYDYPQGQSFVMGVGGIRSDGNNYGLDGDQEVSGYAGGYTTVAACSGTSFCDPNGAGYTGGTSAATAIVAGIAGLVRDYLPGLSASQTRDRLYNTARGAHKKVDALAAITNDRPLNVSIEGPFNITSPGTHTWNAEIYGADGPVSYTWELKIDGFPWHQVGTGSSYSRIMYEHYQNESFDLRVSASSGGESDTHLHYVTSWL